MRANIFAATALVAFALSLTAASGEEKDMKESDLTALLEGGKTLQLGGKDMGYSGSLVLSADGTGKGSAKTDDGTEIVLEGKWRIRGDKFCRTWEAIDDGREVCERWRLVAPNSAEIYQGQEKVGLNSW